MFLIQQKAELSDESPARTRQVVQHPELDFKYFYSDNHRLKCSGNRNTLNLTRSCAQWVVQLFNGLGVLLILHWSFKPMQAALRPRGGTAQFCPTFGVPTASAKRLELEIS